MAKTTNKTVEIPEEKIIDTEVAIPQLNLEQQITVTSIAGWNVGFARKTGVGDVNIPPKGSMRLSINEVITQVQSGNKLFTGIDGFGSHATIIIQNERVLKEVGFENAVTFSDDLVKSLFAIGNVNRYEEELKNKIVTRAEKYAFMASVAKLGLNDYSKIRIAEEYTGYILDRVRATEENPHF